ncbi:unnamed protein product [Caenorhabditis brenneri]
MQKVVKIVTEKVISRKNETLLSCFHTDFTFKNCYDSYDRELLVKILLSESKKDFALKIVEYDTRRSDRLKLLVRITGIRRYEKIDAEFLLDYGRNKIMSGRQMDCEDACKHIGTLFESFSAEKKKSKKDLPPVGFELGTVRFKKLPMLLATEL